MILAKIRYEIYDQELLIIIIEFKQYRHHLKNSCYSIIVLTNHNNFQYFIKTTTLNSRQSRWALSLTKFNFEIKYRSSKINSTNELSRCLNYEDETNDEICLLTLQNKLKNIIIVAIEIISILTRNVRKALTSRVESELAFS